MEAKRSWWQKIKQHPVATVLIALLAVVIILIILSILGYIFNWGWTGLSATDFTSTPPNITRTIVYQPGKTLWDWLQLLIIPLVLAVIAILFNRATTRTEQKIAQDRYEQDKEIASRHYHQDRAIAKQRYEQDQQIALDKQREDLLQSYLDRMSELLLEKGLRTSQADAEVRNVARTRTISVLRQLDARRVGDVFTFLCEAGLMETPEPIVRLGNANLSEVNWSEADLTDANLSVANLSGADLSSTFLAGADLSNAHLIGINLSNAFVWSANLSGADLSKADLSGAFLAEVDLRSADLTEADLREANLSKANLIGADLHGADLSGADLRDVEFITNEGLEKQAKSLKGATMPNGSIHP